MMFLKKDFGVFVHNKPEAEAQRRYAHSLSLCLVIQMQHEHNNVRPLGCCVQKPLNLENTTSSVQSVLLLIYDHDDIT